MSADRMPGGIPERRLDERDDTTSWEREAERSAPPYQLCKGLFRMPCQAVARPHTGRCEACDDYIENLGTGGT